MQSAENAIVESVEELYWRGALTRRKAKRIVRAAAGRRQARRSIAAVASWPSEPSRPVS